MELAQHVQGLHHSGLFVASLDEALSFYRGQLGMRVELALNRTGLRVVMLAAGDSRLELLEVTPTSQEERRAPGLRHVAFQVADVDTAYADLRSQGTSFLEPPVGGTGGWPRACFFRAPDGTFIELIQPLTQGE
jgi:catechol 2,3-dioxygenase-like lactoylglutathione lyase family enzyme